MKTNILQIKNIVLFSFVMLITGLSFGQNNLQKAQLMVSEGEYQKAIEYYNDYFKLNTPTVDEARNLAQCYMMVNDSKSATEWMSKVVEYKNAKESDKMIYGNLLKSQGQYENAIAQFKAYKAMVPSQSEEADKWIKACKDAKDWMANPEFFDVANAKLFNSPYSEFGLTPFVKAYIITSDRKLADVKYTEAQLNKANGNPYYKMYYIKTDKSQKSIKEIKLLEGINNEYHNGPGVYDEENKTLYFTRTKMVKAAKSINPDPTNWFDLSNSSEYVNRLELFTAKYDNGKWIDIRPFAYNKPQEYSVGHPALSPDGNILYFISDMPGGYGETDIYYSKKFDDGSWSIPINAGNTINTAGKEVFPYLDEQGTLFFSSNGHPGLGGLDIYKAKGSRDSWETPENMKFPINSPKDDFSIFYTETYKSGFMASNRDGGMGSDDIYSFEFNPPKEVVVVIRTKDKLDSSMVDLGNVDVTIVNKFNNKDKKCTTDANGTVYVTLPALTLFEIKGKKDEYLSTMKIVETKCKSANDTITVELEFNRLVIDKPITLNNIYYDFNKSNIRPDAAVELDKLVMILKQNPKIFIELSSHTDSRGNDEYNMVLSQKRADAAVNYIISKGISPKRLTAKGYGETRPVNECTNNVKCTEAQHLLNRRTEFVVTGVKNNPSVKSNKDKPENSPIPKYYTVEKGKTLYSIAKMFNTTVEKLKALNNLPNDNIKAGQTLMIY
jgi:outer membrane protein OmpA-like peptidoglycan-associated protein/tetratricopeptide (TPR) repeat protein